MQASSTPVPHSDSFFHSLPLGYVAVRCDGLIAQVNAAIAAALDYQPGDLVGRAAMEFPFDDANRTLFREQLSLRSEGIPGAYVLHLRGHLNRRVPVGCFAVPQYNLSGQFWGSRGIIVPFDQIGKLAMTTRSFDGGDPFHHAMSLFGISVPPSFPSLGAPSFRNGMNGVEPALSPAPLSSHHKNGSSPQLSALLPELTRRERDVVALLLMGLRVNGIAERLQLSHYTVRNHLKRIFRKAGVNSQGQLLLKLNTPP